MKGLQPTLRLGRDVWDRVAMPVEEFHGRVARLRAFTTAENLDALLLYGRGLDQCGHPTWVSNYIVKLPFAALVVLPREGEPLLLFQGAARGRAAAGDTTWMEDVRPCWDLPGECLRVLTERGLTRAAIGLAGLPRLMPFGDWEALARGLPEARLVDAEPAVDWLRAIKSPCEIAQVERARHIVHDSLHHVTQLRAQRLTEAGVAAEVIRAARRRGAQDIRLALGRFLERGWMFAPPEDTPIDPGGRVCVSLAASWDRYWAEAAVTIEAGAGGLFRAGGREADERLRALVGRVRPGASATTLRQPSPDKGEVLDVRGIGITPEEPPMLSTASERTIEAGMCLVLHATLHESTGSVYGADTVVVAESSRATTSSQAPSR